MADRALPDLTSRIQIDTTSLPKAEAHAKSFTASLVSGFGLGAQGSKNFEEGLKKSTAALEEHGKGVEGLASKLGNLSGVAGLGGAGLAALGLTAALGTGLEVVKSSIEGYVSFGEQVLNFQRVTGLSAETSSRLVDVFDQLGVSSETADKAMFQLAKRTEEVGAKTPTAGKTLAELGVQIVKTADGSTDLSKTLFAVADAYSASDSAAQRDAIAFAAFGKAGAALIPVLEQGSAGLEAMTNQAQRVFDQEQLEQVHKYNIEMKQAGQNIDSAKDKIGGQLLPVLSGAADAYNRNAVATAYADEQARKLGDSVGRGTIQYSKNVEEGARLYEQNLKNATAAQKHSDAVKLLDDQLRQTQQDQAALYTSDQSLISAQVAQQRSAISVREAQKTLGDELVKDAEYADKHAASVHAIEAAQDKLTEAVKKYGAQSDQATAAQDALNKQVDAGKLLDLQSGDAATNLSKAQLDVTDAIKNQATAAVELAVKQAEAAGTTLDTASKTDIFRQSLLDAEATLAPSSPLRVQLQQYIDELNNLPTNKTTTITTDYVTTGSAANSAGGGVITSRQGGGSVVPGGIYDIHADERLVMFAGGGGFVIPAGSSTTNRTLNVTQNFAAGPGDPGGWLASMKHLEGLYA